MKRFRVVLALALLWLSWPTPAHAASSGAEVVPEELLVRLKAPAPISPAGRSVTPLDRLLREAGVVAALPVDSQQEIYRLRLRAGADVPASATLLAADPQVAYAEPNRVRTLLRESNDPLLARQTSLYDIRAPEAWEVTTGAEIPIAILDTGVSPTHLDLKRKLMRGVDVFNRDDDPRDDEGHGTHMAGIAAADSDNGEGVAGVCWGCTIIPVKALSRRGRGDDATIAAAIRWAADNGARIISLSLGGPEDSQTLREAVGYAAQRNVLLVAASGNGQTRGNQPNYPAAYPDVLAVAATDTGDRVAAFSTSGNFVDIAAPGVGVLSTLWVRLAGDDYGVVNGTSPAAPHVAGAAALVWSVRPELTPQQVSEVLMAAADDIALPGKDPEAGFGRLNAGAAVRLAQEPDLLQRSAVQGAVAGAPPEQVMVALSDGREIRPDASGIFRFDGLGPGNYTVSARGPEGRTLEQQATVSGTQVSVADLRFDFGAPGAQAFQPVGPSAEPGVAYFAETGHTLRGAFRAYWERHGGLAIFGFPISEELVERSDDGREHLVQYFERHRFEYHPENAPPYDVLLARLGDLSLRQGGRDWFTFPKGAPREDCLFFAETGHALCGDFLRYWRANGLEIDGRAGKTGAESLALFGQPLSEPQLEVMADGVPRVVQWFERARFESHPEGVLLGLLSSELATMRGLR